MPHQHRPVSTEAIVPRRTNWMSKKQASLPAPMSPGWQAPEILDLNNAWHSAITSWILNWFMNTWFRKSHVINPYFQQTGKGVSLFTVSMNRELHSRELDSLTLTTHIWSRYLKIIRLIRCQWSAFSVGILTVSGQPCLSHEKELCANNFITHKCLQFPWKK